MTGLLIRVNIDHVATLREQCKEKQSKCCEAAQMKVEDISFII